MKIYGIPNCNKMKIAFDELTSKGIDYEFHDYKKKGIDTYTLNTWIDKVGIEKLINKKGTTYKKLEENEKIALENVELAIEIIQKNTSMLVRPIYMDEQNEIQFII
ncbi:MAG: ArsC/Spx/MgsR family protein [Leadbetterella sp.]